MPGCCTSVLWQTLTPRAIEGTEGAASPFFSPDGEWIGFFAGPLLKRVSLNGGFPITVQQGSGIRVNRGATWGSDDTLILAGSANAGLRRGSMAGEDKARLEGMSSLTTAEEGHAWPEALPGGQYALYTDNAGGTPDAARVTLVSLETGTTRSLGTRGSNPRYSETGHVLYARSGSLFALPFAAGQGETTGPEFRLLDGLMTAATGAAQFAVSANGTLAYVAGEASTGAQELVSVNRDGSVETLHDSGG